MLRQRCRSAAGGRRPGVAAGRRRRPPRSHAPPARRPHRRGARQRARARGSSSRAADGASRAGRPSRSAAYVGDARRRASSGSRRSPDRDVVRRSPPRAARPTDSSAKAHTIPVRSLPAAQCTTTPPGAYAMSRSAPTTESGRSRQIAQVGLDARTDSPRSLSRLATLPGQGCRRPRGPSARPNSGMSERWRISTRSSLTSGPGPSSSTSTSGAQVDHSRTPRSPTRRVHVARGESLQVVGAQEHAGRRRPVAAQRQSPEVANVGRALQRDPP